MIIKDRIYGRHTITSPVLKELILSYPIQRLKGISQLGLPDEFQYVRNFTRYEHSIGVMLLLKILGASEEEQIAGLLHDASHTAFSHVIDWVVNDYKQEDRQDRVHKKYLKKSGIEVILNKYHYSLLRISNHHDYSLLDQEMPLLCADRVDYAFRDPLMQPKYYQLFKNLISYEGRIVFKDVKSALIFGEKFLYIAKNHWSSFEGVSRYKVLALMLRRSLKLRIISMKDFWQDDKFIINKLNNTQDKRIQFYLKVLRKKSLKTLPKAEKRVYKKFRCIDPEFIEDDQVYQVSNRNKSYKIAIEKAKEISSQGIEIIDLKKLSDGNLI